MLVAQTTRPVQKNRLRDELQSYVRTDTVDWGLGGGRKRGEKQAEEAARTTRRRKRREWQLNEQRKEIYIDVEEGEENLDVEEREKERGRGSNLRRQRLASPTAQVLVAQTTRPVQKNRLRDELQSYVRTDTVDWGLGGGRKRGKKQAEEAARTNWRRTKKRMAAERTAQRDKYRR